MKNIIADAEGDNMSTGTQTANGWQRPAWADPANDQRQDDGGPEDTGVALQSKPVTWDAETGPISVCVDGFRHDEGTDWADTVTASGALNAQGSEGICLGIDDARKLAHAILAACELITSDGSSTATPSQQSEGAQGEPPMATGDPVAIACTEFPCDAAYRRRAHGPGEIHSVHWGAGYKEGELGDTLWRVSAVAEPDSYWDVRVRVGGSFVDLSTDQAEDLQTHIRRAQRCADKANHDSDAQYAVDLSKDLDAMRAGQRAPKDAIALSLRDAARMVGLSEALVRRAVRDGQLPALQVEEARVVLLSDLQAWIEAAAPNAI